MLIQSHIGRIFSSPGKGFAIGAALAAAVLLGATCTSCQSFSNFDRRHEVVYDPGTGEYQVRSTWSPAAKAGQGQPSFSGRVSGTLSNARPGEGNQHAVRSTFGGTKGRAPLSWQDLIEEDLRGIERPLPHDGKQTIDTHDEPDAAGTETGTGGRAPSLRSNEGGSLSGQLSQSAIDDRVQVRDSLCGIPVAEHPMVPVALLGDHVHERVPLLIGANHNRESPDLPIVAGEGEGSFLGKPPNRRGHRAQWLAAGQLNIPIKLDVLEVARVELTYSAQDRIGEELPA